MLHTNLHKSHVPTLYHILVSEIDMSALSKRNNIAEVTSSKVIFYTTTQTCPYAQAHVHAHAHTDTHAYGNTHARAHVHKHVHAYLHAP